MRIDPDPGGDRRRRVASRGARRRRPARRLRRLLLGLVLAVALVGTAPVALLRVADPPLSAFMLRDWVSARAAGRAGFGLEHTWVPLADIAPEAVRAVIAAEDQKFFRHRGFDLEAMQAAMAAHRAGAPLRGASTISQQTAKNLFLWPGRSWLRKGLEAWFTVLLELVLEKRRILEIYLNVAQFGDGVYGVEAASRRFFGKPAAALTAREAARLAAVLPNPLARRVERPTPFLARREAWILRQMHQLGDLPGAGSTR